MESRQVLLAARLRPINPREASQGAKSCVVIDGACTTLVNPETGNARAFVLDYSYDSSEPNDTSGAYASNLTIFKDLGIPMLSKALEGCNTCLFTHGQSGSGKTYTMIGQENDPGLMPRMLEALFQQESVRSGQILVQASFCEILNDQVRDILQRDYYSPGGLKVRSGDGAGCVVEGLSKTTLTSMTDCEELLGKILRSLGVIPQAAHTVFTIELKQNEGGGGVAHGRGRGAAAILSKVHLVDLAGCSAGCDTVLGAKPKSTPQDKSLLAWANVMSALAENQLRALQHPGAKVKQVHVPFRGSVLTRILEDSMGGASQCSVIATLSPSHLAYKETLNTFRLVVRMKEVKKVSRNASILNAYMPDPDFIPAAGGGWRWAYCTKMPEGDAE